MTGNKTPSHRDSHRRDLAEGIGKPDSDHPGPSLTAILSFGVRTFLSPFAESGRLIPSAEPSCSHSQLWSPERHPWRPSLLHGFPHLVEALLLLVLEALSLLSRRFERAA